MTDILHAIKAPTDQLFLMHWFEKEKKLINSGNTINSSWDLHYHEMKNVDISPNH